MRGEKLFFGIRRADGPTVYYAHIAEDTDFIAGGRMLPPVYAPLKTKGELQFDWGRQYRSRDGAILLAWSLCEEILGPDVAKHKGFYAFYASEVICQLPERSWFIHQAEIREKYEKFQGMINVVNNHEVKTTEVGS